MSIKICGRSKSKEPVEDIGRWINTLADHPACAALAGVLPQGLKRAAAEVHTFLLCKLAAVQSLEETVDNPVKSRNHSALVVLVGRVRNRISSQSASPPLKSKQPRKSAHLQYMNKGSFGMPCLLRHIFFSLERVAS